jgi:hypothetical protein
MFETNRATSRLKTLERRFSITANPDLSITYLALIRARIFVEWLVKRIHYSKFHHAALKPTRLVKNSSPSLSALVIGNGPSAGKLEWSRVAEAQRSGLKVFAINYFPLSEASATVIPNFLVLSDPVMKPSTSMDNRTSEMWKRIRENPPGKLVVPVSWFQIMNSKPEITTQILYFDDNGLEGWTKNISPIRPRGYLALTAYKALAFASYLGFNRIYIIGIDNSMFRSIAVDEKNRLVQYPNHFFEQGAVTSDISDLYPKGMSDYFRDMSLCFSSLSKYFSHLPIVNLDENSLVDCFIKESSSSLLK